MNDIVWECDFKFLYKQFTYWLIDTKCLYIEKKTKIKRLRENGKI